MCPMDPRGGTWVFGLGRKRCYLLSHLAGPALFVFHPRNLHRLTDFTSTRGPALALCGVGFSSACAVCSRPYPQPPAWTSLGSGPGHAALQLPVDVSASTRMGARRTDGVNQSCLRLCPSTQLSPAEVHAISATGWSGSQPR